MRLLAVVHDTDSGPGLLRGAAEARGVEVVETSADDRLTVSIDGFDLLLDLGAAAGVNDDGIRHWFSRELALLRDADTKNVPILGVCFGAQALAVALGGSVERAKRPEIGWFDVDTTAPELIEAGPWFEWHVDAITLPPSAELLATTPTCVQAYSLRRHLAVQFHPEVTDRTVADWCAAEPRTLERLGLDAEAMVQSARGELAAATTRAQNLFDRFLLRASIAADAAAVTAP